MTDELAGKRLVILGLARQGKAMARFASEIGAEVVVSDLRSAEELSSSVEELADLQVEMVLGEHPQSLLEGTDVLAISGGVSADAALVEEARMRGIRVTNDSLEFVKRAPGTVIGITGSAGKTTTTALTGSMGRLSGRHTWVGGNIGRPLISALDQMSDDDIVVQELSSFQLELWTQSPPVAAVLNITPNHLDRHETMEAYSAAKANILRFQGKNDVAVLSADDAGAMSLRDDVRGRLRLFSRYSHVDDGAYVEQDQIWLSDEESDVAVCDLQMIPLRGAHNVFNVLAAVTLADSVGVPIEAIREGIVSFQGVEHRLEKVRTINDVQYINDSIATAPERALAALNSFSEPLILLAGGRDKKMVWSEWARKVHQRVKIVILFGELADQLNDHLESLDSGAAGTKAPKIARATTLGDAVQIAHSLAEPGDVVLLAPGGTSYDAYEDFAARGEAFRGMVNALAGKITDR